VELLVVAFPTKTSSALARPRPQKSVLSLLSYLKHFPKLEVARTAEECDYAPASHVAILARLSSFISGANEAHLVYLPTYTAYRHRQSPRFCIAMAWI